jgi:hypothetical protein
VLSVLAGLAACQAVLLVTLLMGCCLLCGVQTTSAPAAGACLL